MPYVTKESRVVLDPWINGLLNELERIESSFNPGEINYIFTRIILAWFRAQHRYTTINAILGVLSAVGHEFYRRHVVDYEMQKISENGDVR